MFRQPQVKDYIFYRYTMKGPVDLFKQQFETLCTQLTNWYPDNKDIGANIMLVRGLLRANINALITIFHEHTRMHIYHILKGDDEYFLTQDDQSLNIDAEHSDITGKIRELWADMSNERRNMLKKIFKGLVIVSTLHCKDAESLAVVNKFRKPDKQLTF